MWRLEKDPHLVARRSPRCRSSTGPPTSTASGPAWSGPCWAVPRLRQRVQPAPVNLSAAVVGRRPRLRHRPPRPPHRPAQAGLDAPAARPGHPDRARPLRPHPPAVAVHRRRGPARRQGGALQKMHHTITDGEGGCRCRCSSSTSSATPRPAAARPPAATAAERRRRRRPRPRRSATCSPAASGCRSASPARSASCSPTRRRSRPPARPPFDTIRGVVTQLSDVEQAHSPLWTRAVAAPPPRDRCGRRSAPTKAAAKRLGGTLNTAFLTAAAEAAGALPPASSAPRSSAAGLDGDQHPHRESGANAFSLARMLVPTGEMPIAERFQADPGDRRRGPGRHGGGRAGDAGRGGRRAADVARHPPRPPAGPDRRLRHVQRARRAGAVYIAGAQLLRELPDRARWPAWRSTSRCCRYIGSLDMGLNIDAAAVAEPARLAAPAGAGVQGPPTRPDRVRTARASSRAVQRERVRTSSSRSATSLGRHQLAVHHLRRGPGRSPRGPRRSRRRASSRTLELIGHHRAQYLARAVAGRADRG